MNVNRTVKLVFEHIRKSLGKPINYNTLPEIRRELHRVDFEKLAREERLARNTVRHILGVLRGKELPGESARLLRRILDAKRTDVDILIRQARMRYDKQGFYTTILMNVLRNLGVVDVRTYKSNPNAVLIRKHEDSDQAILTLWGHLLRAQEDTGSVGQRNRGRRKRERVRAEKGARIREALEILGVGDTRDLGPEHMQAIKNLSRADWETRGWHISRHGFESLKARLKRIIEENERIRSSSNKR
jgi:hypothetical protein